MGRDKNFTMRLYFVVILVAVVRAYPGGGGGSPAGTEDVAKRKELWSNMTKEIRMYKDDKVQPCDNFYQYVCGNFEKHHPLTHERQTLEMKDVLLQRMKKFRMEAVAEPVDDNKNDAMNKAKQFYKLCTDKESRRQRGVQPLIDFIKSIGGWHALNQTFDEKNFDWLDTVAKLSNKMITPLIYFSVGSSETNKETNSIRIYEDYLLGDITKEEILRNSPKLQVDRKFIEAVLLKTNVQPDVARETADDILKFCVALVNITDDSLEPGNLKDQQETLTFEQLQSKIPDINWLKFFRTVLGTRPNPKQEVVLTFSPYVHRLPKLIANTSPKTLSNYINWRILENLSQYTDGRYDTIDRKDVHIIFRTPRSNANEECAEQADRFLPKTFQAAFIRKHFSEESKADAYKMVEHYRKVLKEVATKKDWLDDKTKTAMSAKLDDMLVQVGYPDEFLASDTVNELYKDFKVVPDRYFETLLNALPLREAKNFKHLEYKHARTDWPQDYSGVLDYFYTAENKLAILAGILQPPMYHQDFPKALLYGASANTIGSRIVRALSKQTVAWSDASLEAYNKLTDCFVNQYSKYSFNGTAIQGKNSLEQNVFETAGVRLAWKVYNEWLDKYGAKDNLVLTDLEFDKKQLFFVGYVHTLCQAMDPALTMEKLKEGYEVPMEVRVRGTLSNVDEFAEAFKCPVGGNMNPAKRCSVW